VKAQHTPFKVAFAAALAFALGFLGFDFGPALTYISTNFGRQKRIPKLQTLSALPWDSVIFVLAWKKSKLERLLL
jgi:hypothetical protein